MSAPAYGAHCECGVKVSIDGDGAGVPEPGEWEEFPTCPVCSATLYFDDLGETQWQREDRLVAEVWSEVEERLRAIEALNRKLVADAEDARAQSAR